MDTVFRTRTEPTPEPTPEKPAEVTGIVDDPNAIPRAVDTQTLEDWETVNHTKYGAKFLGVEEISKRFPYNAHFSEIDKYIKAEMEQRGYDKTPKAWQDILAEIEDAIGSQSLNAIERLQKVRDYLRVLKKLQNIKKQKEAFTLGKVL